MMMALVMLIIAGGFVLAEGQQEGADGGYVIGFSNGYIGNGWRTQMIDSVEDLAAFYKGKGWVKDIIIQNAGLDVNTQIGQIQNMIAMGVDLLLMWILIPKQRLIPVIEEAN